MIQQNVFLVIEQTGKGKLAIKQKFTHSWEADAYLAENPGGFLVKGTELVDEFAPQPPQPEIAGPVHKHRGAVPPMAMPPTQPGQPFPVIDIARAFDMRTLEDAPEEYITLENQTEEPTRLDISPQFFADILAALEQQTLSDED